jgi:phospholipase A1
MNRFVGKRLGSHMAPNVFAVGVALTAMLVCSTHAAEDGSAFESAAPVLTLHPAFPAEAESPVQYFDVHNDSLDATSTTKPSTHPSATQNARRPEAASAAEGEFPTAGGSYGLDEFIHHFAPHEPMYIIGGTKAPQVKFQLSIRYRLLNPDGPLASKYQLLKGFNFAYSQTSLWDWSDPNMPFFYDSSYRPEFFYYLENLPKGTLPEGWQAGFQSGYGHESNGQRDPDHRSINILFLRPILTISQKNTDLFLTLAPKFYDYIGDLDLNPDIAKYRGYCDIRAVVGQRDGLQLAGIGRIGSNWDKGSAQMDLTYPLTKILDGNVDLLLDAQYFIGYGETLLTYNKYTQIFRIGLALVR